MRLEHVIEGLEKYIEQKLFPSMVNWQRVTFRTFLGRAKKKPEILHRAFPVLNFFEYANQNGEISIDDFISDFTDAVKAENGLEIPIEVLGLKYKLSPSDAEELCRYLKG